jgi:hypothetical protein
MRGSCTLLVASIRTRHACTQTAQNLPVVQLIAAIRTGHVGGSGTARDTPEHERVD